METDALECFGFDLADTFAGDAEFAADFFEGVAYAVVGETVAHFQYLAFLWRQLVENTRHLFVENTTRCVLVRTRNRIIRNERAERRTFVIIFTDRTLERDRVLVDLLDRIDLIDFNADRKSVV